VEGRFSFDGLVRDARAAYLDHETGVAVLALAELALAAHGLRELPVTEGVTVDLVRQTISDDQARWLMEQVPRVLGPESEECELWSEAGDVTFAEWRGHARAAVADLGRVLGPGPGHLELF
jgi:hypothetical protein